HSGWVTDPLVRTRCAETSKFQASPLGFTFGHATQPVDALVVVIAVVTIVEARSDDCQACGLVDRQSAQVAGLQWPVVAGCFVDGERTGLQRFAVERGRPCFFGGGQLGIDGVESRSYFR